MKAIKLNATIRADHTLSVQLPKDIGAGSVEVIVLVPDEQPSAADLLVSLLGPVQDSARRKSQAEVEEMIRLERETWE